MENHLTAHLSEPKLLGMFSPVTLIKKKSRYRKQKETLTKREKEILLFVVQGLTSKKMGEKLSISYRTVETHRANMMKKFQVNKTSGLILHALQAGIVDLKNAFLQTNTDRNESILKEYEFGT